MPRIFDTTGNFEFCEVIIVFYFENVLELGNIKIKDNPMSENFFQLNIFSQCRKYHIPLWQCPQFLFVVMGLVIMVSSVVVYVIGEHYVTDPRLVAFVVLAVSTIFLIIAFIITRSFEDLAEANRMKAEFVNIVSHQLRAPLTNLRWAVQFLLSEEFTASNKDQNIEYFDIIKENSARMEGLIDDLLTITRLREGKMDNKKAKISLIALTEEVISEHKSIADASNIQLELKASKDLPDVFVSHPLIKIVVENLISNALNYSKGGDKILIELKALDKQIKFQIKDEGIGIPIEDQKRIFQKFFRARNAIRAEVYGTGLGLFIVKLILDGMNGKVWFTSKKDKGSTFYFSLPTG
jgi:signal transduction histidine kinase